MKRTTSRNDQNRQLISIRLIPPDAHQPTRKSFPAADSSADRNQCEQYPMIVYRSNGVMELEAASKHADRVLNVRVSTGLLPNRQKLLIVSNGESERVEIEMRFEMEIKKEFRNGIQKITNLKFTATDSCQPQLVGVTNCVPWLKTKFTFQIISSNNLSLHFISRLLLICFLKFASVQASEFHRTKWLNKLRCFFCLFCLDLVALVITKRIKLQFESSKIEVV